MRSKRIRAGEDRIYTTRSPNRGKDGQAKLRLVTMREKGKLLAFAINMSMKSKRIRLNRSSMDKESLHAIFIIEFKFVV